MQNITPPTDSLYKFVAISGVALVVLGLSLPVAMINQQIEQIRRTRAKTTELKVSFQEIVFPLIVDFENNDEKQVLEKMEELATNDPENSSEKVKELQSLVIELNAQIEEDRYLSNLTRFSTEVGWYVFIAGVVLGIFGFYQWYFRIQRYADMIIQKQANEK